MTKRRLSKADWLDLGLSALSSGGVEALRLDAICGRAGLTKGSFYHHFKDHPAFLQSVVAEWRHRQTDAVISASEQHENPDEALLDQALALDFQLELGMRELSRRDPEIAEIVADVDASRTGYIARLYASRFGGEADTLRDAAFLEYAAFAGFMMLAPDMPPDRQRQLAAQYDLMVTRYFAADNM